VNFPVRFAANTVNRAVDTAQQAGEQTTDTITEVRDNVVDRATSFTGAVRETLAVGRVASLRRAERIARREGNRSAADAVASTRRELGDLTADELPIKGYDSMSTGQIAKAVKDLHSAQDIRTIINYEEARKARAGVVSAAQVRLADLAKEAVGVSS
jgi:hypothetical protein